MAGKIVRDMGNIFIDRQNRRDILRAGERIIERLDDGEGVIVSQKAQAQREKKYFPLIRHFLQFAAKIDLPVPTPRSRTGPRTETNQPVR